MRTTRALVFAAGATVLAMSWSAVSQARDVDPTNTPEAGFRLAGPSPATAKTPATAEPATPPDTEPGRQAGLLQGKTIVVDPGHQLGNFRHQSKIGKPVDAGGFQKACNTTGTSTDAGFPEATFNWRVSRALQGQLRARGATVRLTRSSNSYADWGPCIDERGRAGNQAHVNAVVSIHGDSAASNVHGFFVIRPGLRQGWTDDIEASSRQLAACVKRGLVSARARISNGHGSDGLDVRTDLGTLNWSDAPVVMVELGNMRNRANERHMTSQHYRAQVYARGLRKGLAHFVLHR